MTFLVDNQLPTALARFLASRGITCQHVLDIDLGGASDAAIWEYANRNDCVVISKWRNSFLADSTESITVYLGYLSSPRRQQ